MRRMNPALYYGHLVAFKGEIKVLGDDLGVACIKL